MIVTVGHQRPVVALTGAERDPQPGFDETDHACRVALIDLHAGKHRGIGIGIGPRGSGQTHQREGNCNRQSTVTATRRSHWAPPPLASPRIPPLVIRAEHRSGTAAYPLLTWSNAAHRIRAFFPSGTLSESISEPAAA